METTTRGPIADLSKPGSMTTPAESVHQEGRCATDSLLGPKTKISIGTEFMTPAAIVLHNKSFLRAAATTYFSTPHVARRA